MKLWLFIVTFCVFSGVQIKAQDSIDSNKDDFKKLESKNMESSPKDSKDSTESKSPKDSKTESKPKKDRKKTYNYIYKSIQRLYIDDDNVLLHPSCDVKWQEEFCAGDIMCYSTKCFYSAQTKDLYAIALVEHINSLQDSMRDEVRLHEIMARLRDMVEFGLPMDNAKHDFSFVDSHNFLCKYWVWQRDKYTLEANLTGCRQDVDVRHTFFEEREGGDALSFYKKVLNEHIEFLETQAKRDTTLINRLRELVAFGLPRDNKKHDFSFVDSNKTRCKYWVWRKNKEYIEVNLTGCAKGVEILYTFNSEKRASGGTIEVYTIIDVSGR